MIAMRPRLGWISSCLAFASTWAQMASRPCLVLAITLASTTAPARAADATPVPVNAVDDAGAALSTGGWSHTVPLELLSAPNGLVPGVAVVADHRVTDGPLGTGWRLDGFSRIERRSQWNGVPEMTSSDTYYADGMRLWLDTSTTATNDYRLEKDDNRVFLLDATQNRWDVFRDGWFWRYGEYAILDGFKGMCATETRLQSPDAPCDTSGSIGDAVSENDDTTAWLLSQVRDPSNNFIGIEYASNWDLDDTGSPFNEEYAYQHLPMKIGYGGGKGISFEYETRPDSLTDGRSGRLRVLPARLTAIQVWYNLLVSPTEDARYEFEFLKPLSDGCPGEGAIDGGIDTEAATVLKRIIRTDSSTSPTMAKVLRCIETNEVETTFDESVDLELTSYVLDSDDSDSIVPAVVNFDGDPWPDLVVVNYHTDGTSTLGLATTLDDGEQIFRGASADSYVEITYWENADGATGALLAPDTTYDAALADITQDVFEFGAWAFVDINRDGATDILIVDDVDNTTVHYGAPGGGIADTTWNESLFTAEQIREGQFTDIDGDGFVDLVLDGQDWIQNSGEPPYIDTDVGTPPALVTPLTDTGSAAYTERQDLYFDCTSGLEYLEGGYRVFQSGSVTLATNAINTQGRFGDVNGDGLADVTYSFYTCFDEYEASTGGFDSPTGPFSRIFYGDGTGTFHDSLIGPHVVFEKERVRSAPDFRDRALGGEGTWVTANGWTIADLDRSGRAEELYWSGFSSSGDMMLMSEVPDLGLPEGYSTEACPHDVCESTGLPFGGFYDPYAYLEHNILADWTGDGFPDVLKLRQDVNVGSSVSAGETTLFTNLRTVSRHRITTIHDAWGGEIALTYTSSAGENQNTEMPYSVEVIASVDDEHGLTEYSFEGGYTRDGRFAGFMEAGIRHQGGRTTALKFAQSWPYTGDLVSRTEYREDQTIETFSFYDYVAQLPSGLWYLDTHVPFFNPVRRKCDFWLGPGAESGTLYLQSLDEVELAEMCVEWEQTSAPFNAPEWQAILGWDRDPGGGLAADLADAVWNPAADVYEYQPSAGSIAGWPGYLGTFATRSEYLPVVGALPEEVDAPTAPSLPAYLGLSTTEFRMYVEEFAFNSNQRLTADKDFRDTSIPTDDVYVQYGLDAWDTSARGQRIQSVTWRDSANSALKSVHNSNWFAFDRPQTVEEEGVGGFGYRTWTYAYNKGDVSSVTDPDGETTGLTRGMCGDVVTRTDAEEQAWSGSFTACRLTSWSWEGSSGTISYDALGRMTERTVSAGEFSGDPTMTEEWLRDDVLDYPDDRSTRAEPRSAHILGDGTLEFTYLDPWGRPFFEETCTGQAGTTGGIARECVPGTEVRRMRGWSVDGQVSMETDPYVFGELPASTWEYRDVFGRVEWRYEPTPQGVIGTDPMDWVGTNYLYLPGETTVVDPGGHTCVTTFDTLDTDTTCAGSYRGGRTVGPLGHVKQEETADHVVWETDYDVFLRPEARKLDTAIATYPGTSDLARAWTWSAAGRLLSETDPAGGVRAWTYDGIGRPITAKYTPPSASQVTINTWTWHKRDSGGRWLTMTDVNGAVTTTHLDALERSWKVAYPDGSTAERDWNAGGRLASSVDVDGLRLNYVWNPDGTLDTESVPGTLIERVFGHDGAGRLVSMTDRDGVTTEYGWTWDGRPAWTDRLRATGDPWQLSTTEYNDDGLVILSSEGGVTSTYNYDGLHQREDGCIGVGTSPTCAVDVAWTYTAAGLVESETRARGTSSYQTQWEYNAVGWPTRVVHPDTEDETWAYDARGAVRQHLDESGRDTVWTYDGWGRPATEQRPGETTARTFTYGFGVLGSAELHLVTEPDGGEWRTWYDFAGRAVREEYPDGTALERWLDGSRLQFVTHHDDVDDVIAREVYTYDSLGHLDRRWGPVDEDAYDTQSYVPITGDYLFSYTSTDEGRRLTVSDPEILALTTFEWTDGVLTGEDIDNVADITYTYDADYPRQSGATYYGGRSVTRTYERGLWLATETFSEGSVDLVRTFGGWDAYGQPGTATSNLDTVDESAYAMTRDSRGRLHTLQIDPGLGTALGTVTYSYFPDGAVQTVETDTTWGADGYTYVRSSSGDLLSEVRQVTGNTLLASFSDYDDLGRAQAVSLVDGGQIHRSWDQNGRVSTFDVTNASSVEVTRTYQYDARGRLEQLVLSDGTVSRTDVYGYQEPGWLISETQDQGSFQTLISYTYDAAGNREDRDDGTTFTDLDYGVGNKLTSVDSASVTWDDFGGVTVDHRGNTITRAPDGGEIGLEVGTDVFDFVRDAYGRQVGAYSTVGDTRMVWGNPGADLPLATIDEEGTAVLNVAAGGILLAQLRDGVPLEAVTDPSGSLVMNEATFLELPGSWGDDATAQAVGAGGTATERYVYAGLQSLPGTPYQMARQRMYDPELGRFMSMDPIGLAGGDHRFGYANGDPNGFTDPEGLVAGGVWDPQKHSSTLGTGGKDITPTIVTNLFGGMSSTIADKLGLECTASGCHRIVGKGDLDPNGRDPETDLLADPPCGAMNSACAGTGGEGSGGGGTGGSNSGGPNGSEGNWKGATSEGGGDSGGGGNESSGKRRSSGLGPDGRSSEGQLFADSSPAPSEPTDDVSTLLDRFQTGVLGPILADDDLLGPGGDLRAALDLMTGPLLAQAVPLPMPVGPGVVPYVPGLQYLWDLYNGPTVTYPSRTTDGDGNLYELIPGTSAHRLLAGSPDAPGVTTDPRSTNRWAPRWASSGLDDLAKFRGELGLPEGAGTLARLDVGGQSFYGINAHGQTVTMSVNAITRTHAEGDAFQQAIAAGASATSATLYVDRPLCASCGTFGGVRGMARQLGLDSLKVVTPSGTEVITP